MDNYWLGKRYQYKFKVGDRVKGYPILSNKVLAEGVVVKQDAGISRDAMIVKLDNGKNVIMLEDTAEKV